MGPSKQTQIKPFSFIMEAAPNRDMSDAHAKRKFFSRYGILGLPVLVMCCFGLFGFRPGQFVKGILGYVINGLFIFNFMLVSYVGITYFIITSDYSYTVIKFLAGFVTFMVVKFSYLCFIFYKKYNIVSLCEVLIETRRNHLSKKGLIQIITTIIFLIGVIMYSSSYFIEISLEVLKNGSVTEQYLPLTIQTSNPTALRVLVILEMVIYMNLTWSAPLITSFMTLILAIIMKEEFEKCKLILTDNISKGQSLSSERFLEFNERFSELKLVMFRIDDLFSIIIGLNLVLSLGMLCGAIYATTVPDDVIRDWSIPIMISVMTLLMLIPSTAAVHNEVTVDYL